MSTAELLGPSASLPPESLKPPIVVSALMALVWLIVLTMLGPVGYLAPLGLLLAAGGVWVIASAMQGRTWALAGILGFALVVPNVNFMPTGLHEGPALNAQTGLKLLLWASMGIVALTRLPRCLPLMRDRAILSIGLFALVATASTLWSVTPIYTAIGSMGFLAALLFACAVAAELSEVALYRTVVVSFLIYIAMNIAAAVAMPEVAWLAAFGESDSPRLQGVSSHPNILGKEMAAFICLFLPLALAYGKKRTACLLTALAFGVLIATLSRTSLGAILIALALPVLVRLQVARPLIWLVVAATGVALLALAAGFVPDLRAILDGASRSSDASEILTLTGRTELWGFVWDKILEAPFFGHGFGAADAVLSPQWWGAPDASVGAHNTWLQALLIVGVIGTIPFVWFHMELIRRFFADRHSPTRFIAAYLFILGLTEVEIAAHPVMLTIATFLLVALEARRKQRTAERT